MPDLRFTTVCLTALLGLSASLAGSASQAAAPADIASNLIAHRAVYDLTLKGASDSSGIAGMSGRMVYEFTGSSCKGFKTTFRYVTEVDSGDQQQLTDQQTVTFEELAKGHFRFDTKSYTNEKLEKEVSGKADASKDGMAVSIERPEAKKVDLEAGIFPTEHMMEIIERARKGERMFETRVFDGSDNGDNSLLATAFVGPEAHPVDGDQEIANIGPFSSKSFWPVTIAYFNGENQGDELPVYRMSFKLYDNGITRDLTMDYGDFVLTGKLAKLELLKTESCK